jgi:tetratricopeptide (TPR) repeat protein
LDGEQAMATHTNLPPISSEPDDAAHISAPITPAPPPPLALPMPGTIAGITPPLIGRDAPLQQLLTHFYALVEGGELRLITVIGAAGLGKSRLAYEVHHWVARLPEAVVCYTFSADQQKISEPYSLLRMLVEAICGIHAHDPLDLRRARIEQGLTALFGSAGLERAHLIGQLIGYDFSASPVVRGVLDDARQLRDRAVHYVQECLIAITAQTPLLVIVDDFHLADDSSLGVFEQLTRNGRTARLLLITLAQQRLYDRRPTWGYGLPYSERIDLQPLAERDSRRMVAELLRKVGKLPTELRNLLVNRAEGNPLFLEELVKMLIAEGTIVPAAEGWELRLGRLARLHVPGNLRELLRDQILGLAPQQRDLLLRAAVVGRTFWAGATLALGEHEQALGAAPVLRPNALPAVLVSLERKDLIVPQPASRFPGDEEYAFRHELLHEVAYDLVPPEQRQIGHIQAAQWMIARSRPGADRVAAQVADHFARAGSSAEAAHWHRRAGDDARRTYALTMALEHYRSALTQIDGRPDLDHEQLASLEGLGCVQMDLARLSDAVASFTQMAQIAERLAAPALAARAWNQLAFVQDTLGDPRSSQRSAIQANQLALQGADQAQLALSFVRQGWAEIRLDNPHLALELGDQALRLFESLDDRPNMARCIALIGMAHEHIGNYAEATRHLERALAIDRSVGNLSSACSHLNNLAVIANACGDFPAALSLLYEDLALTRAIGSRVGEIYALSNLGTALIGMGDYATAETEIRRGIHLCEVSRIGVFSDFYRDLAEVCLAQGREVEALEAAQQALDLSRDSANPREVGAALRVLGMALSRLGDTAGATSILAESVRVFQETRAEAELARTLRTWARQAYAWGDVARAQALWHEAHALFCACNLPLELARSTDLADLLPDA